MQRIAMQEDVAKARAEIAETKKTLQTEIAALAKARNTLQKAVDALHGRQRLTQERSE